VRVQLSQNAAVQGADDGRHRLVETIKSLYFPALVLAAGALGIVRPKAYALLTDGFVTNSLALVMVLMGCSLTLKDFKDIAANKKAVMLGW
jgi:predicted Na+-dependent transporter